MGVTMETRNKGKRTQRRAHRDDGVELLARPRNIGRPPCPSSIPRFFFGNAKLRPKPLGKKLKLLSTQKVEGTHKSSAPHLFGSLLRCSVSCALLVCLCATWQVLWRMTSG